MGEKVLFVVGDGGLLFIFRVGLGGKCRKKNGGWVCVFMVVDYYKIFGVLKIVIKFEIKFVYWKFV